MDAQTYRVNRPDVIDEHFDQEYVLVNLRTGTYYSLNRTAAVIWDDLIQNHSRAAILARLEQFYRADSDTLAADLDTLLQEMLQEQLILPQSQPSTTDSPATESQAPAPDPGEYLPPLIEKYTDMQALLLLDPIHQVDESGWPATKPDAH